MCKYIHNRNEIPILGGMACKADEVDIDDSLKKKQAVSSKHHQDLALKSKSCCEGLEQQH